MIQETLPSLFETEVVYCVCKNVIMRVDFDGRSIRKSGCCLLSTLRILFNCKNLTVDIPLLNIEKEQLLQPLFGPTALSGKALPLRGSNIANKIEWKIEFRDGIGNFLSTFSKCLAHVRSADHGARRAAKIAFQDPNDGTFVLVPCEPSDSFIHDTHFK